ncbi:MAG: hypothetical protein GY832_36845 [Chloroflexi bacterium]|nr:hypothetical protein [Chloroflexota bacterium]
MIPFDRIHRIVERVHLIYLGLLPALATFAVLAAYGHPVILLVFLGGIVAVSVYLAVVVSYTRSPSSLAVTLFILLDGPVCAVLAQLSGGAPYAFAINSFLVDGLAVWVAIVWLAVTTSRPTEGQRIATVFFALVAVVTVISVFWPYLRESVLGEWNRLGWLLIGMIEAVIARHYLLKADDVVRDQDISVPYILILLFVWIAALTAGNVLHETLLLTP